MPTRQELIAFANRDWSSLAASKEAFWLDRKQRLGPAEGLRAASELGRWVRHQRPDWPTASEREADLATHARVAELLRRAGRS